MRLFRRFLHDERGATAVEYGLMLSLIALLVIGGLGSLGGNLSKSFNNVSNKL